MTETELDRIAAAAYRAAAADHERRELLRRQLSLASTDAERAQARWDHIRAGLEPELVKLVELAAVDGPPRSDRVWLAALYATGNRRLTTAVRVTVALAVVGLASITAAVAAVVAGVVW